MTRTPSTSGRNRLRIGERGIDHERYTLRHHIVGHRYGHAECLDVGRAPRRQVDESPDATGDASEVGPQHTGRPGRRYLHTRQQAPEVRQKALDRVLSALRWCGCPEVKSQIRPQWRGEAGGAGVIPKPEVGIAGQEDGRGILVPAHVHDGRDQGREILTFGKRCAGEAYVHPNSRRDRRRGDLGDREAAGCGGEAPDSGGGGGGGRKNHRQGGVRTVDHGENQGYTRSGAGRDRPIPTR